MKGSASALVGAVLLAGVSTLGDFVWARWIPEHRPAFGLAHGTFLFLVLGAWLGTASRRPGAGAAGGAAIGFAAAAAFYLAAPRLGASAMFAAWFGIWVALAALDARLGRDPRPGSRILARGLLAGAGSGLAFWAISGIWPGLAALRLRRD